MKGKTIFIVVLTALLTIFLMVNNDAVEFNFIIGNPVEVSKLIVIGICILIGFIIGFITGRPRKTYSSYNDEVEKNYADEQKSTLSDEDRDYIS
ncbi:lipopolysaccharide assembly protein LapA domain-containing protein [Nubsella zeaxanthinifaciens]|uniref:lipopolysaccharide assembly protein LapA domain-containing protein n=1 Tax=Nubsella zeaxanthinifaciens TaxID=392412 RepID=UPI000DE3E00D|nr:lipopolysaccharide assembly protein LapA domain-containing protein [Nubsella zeaxanthinifaciens]